MACSEIEFFSPSLNKMTSVNVVIPEPTIPGPYAVFYLLHGLSDNHSAWMRRTSIERYAQGLPLLIVMPDGGRSFYVDAPDGPSAASLIVKDVVGLIDTMFRTRDSRDGRAIGGLSMGGYGALKLGFQYPGLFCSVNSHSGAPAFANRALDPKSDAEWVRVLGPSPKNGPEDVFALAERANRAGLPAFRIDCGVNDFLIESNREFHAHLQTLGIPHEYEEFPGVHDWAYWDLHIQDALAFHARNLGLKG